MAASVLLSLAPGVVCESEGAEWHVRSAVAGVVLRRLSPVLVSALRRLPPPGEEEDRLADDVLAEGGPGELARWYYQIQELARRGLVGRTVQEGQRRLATLVPISPGFVLAPLEPGRQAPARLSRFAYLHREGDDQILEAPTAHARVVVEDGRMAALVWALGKAKTVVELTHEVSDLTVEAVALVVGLLAGAGLLEEGDPQEVVARTWDFHDLLFHARSRKGRCNDPLGATFRGVGQVEVPPSVKPPMSQEVIHLHRPDLEQLERDDPTLARVIEARCSVREFDEPALTVREVGEFLFRVARGKGHREVALATPRGPVCLDLAPRPYPSGGGLYELEFYLAVARCQGLEPGLHHYRGETHQLERLCGRTTEVSELLADSAICTGVPVGRLQVLVILSARLDRLTWKYSSMAYALVLKHVGVVYQTAYLAATAMGLAPCAVGLGDADLFARAAGVDYYAEASVGEFLLGSRTAEGGEGDQNRKMRSTPAM